MVFRHSSRLKTPNFDMGTAMLAKDLKRLLSVRVFLVPLSRENLLNPRVHVGPAGHLYVSDRVTVTNRDDVDEPPQVHPFTGEGVPVLDHAGMKPGLSKPLEGFTCW